MDRVRRGVYVCLGIAAVIALGLSTILYFGGSYIYLLFTADAAVIERGIRILHFLVPTFITYIGQKIKNIL